MVEVEEAKEAVAQVVDEAVDADVASINHRNEQTHPNTAIHTAHVDTPVGIAAIPQKDTSGTPPLKIKWAVPHIIVRIDS